jgi:uncharacterized protein (DUF4415 family)
MKPNVMPNTSETNWERVDALTDAEIDTSDCPPLDNDFFVRATLRPPGAAVVRMAIEPEVLAWYQSQGADYERLMSAALRIYAAAHRPKSAPAT